MVDAAPGLVVVNRVERVTLGIVRATGIATGYRHESLDNALTDLIAERADGLTHELENVRAESRNMLRNGAYKPTGRGKPASEYLLRAASQPGSFPRVNWPVDICNFISLKYVMPISIWDFDAADTNEYLFRLGLPDEEYVFNSAGQTIGLRDLVVGCTIRESDTGRGTPIVNPIKDSMRTKTGPATSNIVASIYAPATAGEDDLNKACAEFAEWLGQSSDSVVTAFTIITPGETGSC